MFWELLYGELPFADTDAVMAGRRRPPPAGARAPRWLRDVLERGLEVEPAARHTDMQALIAAVETSPTSRRLRRYFMAGVALALTLWAVSAQLARSATITGCAAAGAAITESWGDAARADLQASFVATGAPFAASTLERVLPLLDEYVGAWRDARVRVCVAERVDATLPAEQATSMLACLGEAREHLDSLLAILTGVDTDEIGRDAVQSAIAAITTLPRISACEGPTRPRARPTSLDGHTSAEVARIRGLLIKASALGATGRAPEGLAHAEWASTTAAALDFPPVRLEAELQRGLLLAALGRYEDADAALKDTFYGSGRIRHDDVHLDAAIALIHETVNRDKRDESGHWGRTARMLLERDDAGSDLRWALLYRKLGLLHLAQGEYPEAIAMHRSALAVHQRVHGPHHPTIAEDLSNLADCHRLNGEIGRAIELGVRSVELTERALGPDHPGIADGLGNLGVIYGDAGDLPRALETLDRVRELHERTLPAGHTVIGVALNNIGATHYRMGSQELALAAVTRARAILERSLGPEHSEVATSHFTAGLIQLAREQPGTALASLDRARSIWERELPPEHSNFGALHMALCDAHAGLRQWDFAFASCERAVAVYEPFADAELPAYRLALANLGIWLVEAGELTRARPHVERAIELVSRHGDEPGLLGELQFALARCLWHDQRTRADELAQAALTSLTAGGPDYAVDLAKTRSWLTDHSR